METEGEERPVRAAYASRCGICDERIEEGDEIEKYEDEWCHSDCVADLDDAEGV